MEERSTENKLQKSLIFLFKPSVTQQLGLI
jgi:hypothetical protein